MKKLRFLALIMSVLLIFCSSGCNKKKDKIKTNNKPTTSSINSDSNKNDETTIDSSNSSDADDDTNTNEEDNVTSRRPKPVKTDPNAVVRVSWNGPKGYRIIVPDGNADMMKAAKVLQEYIKTKFNTSIDIAEDSVAKTAKEILIGATNRTESVKNTAYNDYSMAVKNGKLVFGAGSYLAAEKAIGIFMNQENPAGRVQEFSGTNDFETTKLGQYKYVWGDEFNGLGFGSSKYFIVADDSQQLTPWEDTDIVEDPSVLDVSDGYLKLNNRRWYNPTNGTVEYAQHALLSTKNTLNYQYGYLEMRARVPIVHGINASLWLTQADTSHKGSDKPKAYSTEIDVFETFASEDTLSFGLHKWFNTGSLMSPKRIYVFEDRYQLSEQYHLYGFEWTPKEMSVYVDGEKYGTFDITQNYDKTDDTDMSQFHEPLCLLLSNGLITPYSSYIPYNGAEINPENLPAEFWIDWIRLYQKPGEGKLILK